MLNKKECDICTTEHDLVEINYEITDYSLDLATNHTIFLCNECIQDLEKKENQKNNVH